METRCINLLPWVPLNPTPGPRLEPRGQCAHPHEAGGPGDGLRGYERHRKRNGPAGERTAPPWSGPARKSGLNLMGVRRLITGSAGTGGNRSLPGDAISRVLTVQDNDPDSPTKKLPGSEGERSGGTFKKML